MIIKKDLEGIQDFEAWSGGETTKRVILENDKEEEFNSLLEEIFPNGCTETELNDFLWFDADSIYDMLGIKTEEDT